MNEENTRALIEGFKFISQRNPLYRNDLDIPMSFDCGDGWFPLIWKLCEDLEKVVGEEFMVDQVKEKFGTLRFYVSATNDEADRLIDNAERMSAGICELCGKPGRLKVKGGWFRTVCEDEKGYQIIEAGD
jgi:hypothetical protein